MKKILIVPMALMVLAVTSTAAMAKPDVKINIIAEKEIVVQIDGKDVVKRVKADGSAPGDVVIYTLSYVNEGDEDARDVTLVDPVPSDTQYINGSVFGPGSDITFSIDGKNYQKASMLSYEVDGKKVTASPDLYTHIRWVVKKIAPGKGGMVGFRVRVK